MTDPIDPATRIAVRMRIERFMAIGRRLERIDPNDTGGAFDGIDAALDELWNDLDAYDDAHQPPFTPGTFEMIPCVRCRRG